MVGFNLTKLSKKKETLVLKPSKGMLTRIYGFNKINLLSGRDIGLVTRKSNQ